MGRPPVADVARAAVRSARVQLSLVTNALSSLGNFSVSIAVARQEEIAAVGLFAVAMASYALVSGAVRGGIAETALAMELDEHRIRAAAGPAAALSIVSGALMVGVGLVWGNGYLVAAGVGLNGLCLYEYVKAMSLAQFRPVHAVVMEIAWFVVTVPFAVAAMVGSLDPFVAFLVWVGAGAAIGYVAAVPGRYRLLPALRAPDLPWRTTGPFIGDYLVGSGSSQVAVNVLTATAGPAVAGSLRSATTLFGPVGLVLMSARTLIVRYLSLGRGARTSWHAAAAVALVMTVPMLPLFLVIAFLPDVIGEAVLGRSWTHAQPLLPVLALEVLFSTLAAVAFAGHKTLMIGRQTVTIRCVLAVVRVGGIVYGGVVAGALGAAVAMAGVSALGCLVWWAAYVRGSRRTIDDRGETS